MHQRTFRPVLITALAAALVLASTLAPAQQRLGNLSSNPYDSRSTTNPYGAGSAYRSDGINNPYSRFGSPYSNHSASNPYGSGWTIISDE